MEYFTKKFENRVRDYCDSQYKIIDVEAGKFNYYFKCHLSASHHAWKKGDDKLALVMYRDKNDLMPYVHFVNYHDGKFIDNTLGEWSRAYEYRFIRWVEKKEFGNVTNILRDTKRVFRDKASVFEKMFGDCTV